MKNLGAAMQESAEHGAEGDDRELFEEREASEGGGNSLDNYVTENTRSFRRRVERRTLLIVTLLLSTMIMIRLLLMGVILITGVSASMSSWLPVECRLQNLGATICLVFGTYNLIALTGWLMQDGWGWWMSVIGIPWVAFQWIASGLVMIKFSEYALPGQFVLGIGILLVVPLSFLVWMMMGRKTQNRFGVMAGQRLPLIVANTVGAVLSGAFAVFLMQQMR